MAVYTQVPNDVLAGLIASYGLGSITACKGIAEGVENTNYLITTTTGTYILTLYEKRVARDDLPFFLGLMEHLAAAGITCPTPLRDARGVLLREVEGRPAAIVTYLSGISLDDPQPGHCAQLGTALAQLHLAGRDFPIRRENSLSLAGWRTLALRLGARADEIAAGLGRDVANEIAYQAAHWPSGLPEGVIHADLFPNNVFFLGDRLSGLIDFYFACNDLLAYDVAVCLNAWCFTPGRTLDRAKAEAMLAAYAAVRPLAPAEIVALPDLARAAALRFLLTRAYDWLHTPASALVKRLDPLEYLEKLRHLQGAADARDLGWRSPA